MKYTFFEALGIVAGSSRGLRFNNNDWHLYKEGYGVLRNINNTGNDWWPLLEQQKAKIWEVEPEAIYVWCRCLKVNESVLSTQSQENDHTPYPDDDEMALFEQKGLFPKDKYKKFKLVPVEED